MTTNDLLLYQCLRNGFPVFKNLGYGEIDLSVLSMLDRGTISMHLMSYRANIPYDEVMRYVHRIKEAETIAAIQRTIDFERELNRRRERIDRAKAINLQHRKNTVIQSRRFYVDPSANVTTCLPVIKKIIENKIVPSVKINHEPYQPLYVDKVTFNTDVLDGDMSCFIYYHDLDNYEPDQIVVSVD